MARLLRISFWPVEFFFSETAHNSETAWYIMIKIGKLIHCIIVKTLVCKTYSDICILALFAMYILAKALKLYQRPGHMHPNV